MRDFSIKHCEHSECTKRASFGLKRNMATHCGTHREKEMINVMYNKLCKHNECTKFANFGFSFA